MLLIKVFLKLWELVQVPLFLPQTIAGIAELSSASATVASEARGTAAIAAIKLAVKSQFTKSSRVQVIHDYGKEGFKTRSSLTASF